MTDPTNLGGGERSTSVPHIPGPDDGGPTPNELIIRGLSGHKIARMDALLAAGLDTGSISVQLSIPSSVIAIYASLREEFDRIRGGGSDPRNLGNAPEAKVGGSGNFQGGGGNYRPGVRMGS